MEFSPNYAKSFPRDALAGLVVFLVALPLCLGVALASNAPPISGLVAGVVGGLLVVWLSGSHTSVSGPAAGLTAIVAAQIATLGSFEAFLVAVMLAGVLQLGMAAIRAGSLAAFFPSSVIKGLLAAIGIILILKQIPHLFGHDSDWLGDLSYHQIDGRNTFSELWQLMGGIHTGPTLVGLASLALLVSWDRTPLARLPLPAPLFVVILAIALSLLFNSIGGGVAITAEHLVQVPIIDSLEALSNARLQPDFSALSNPAILTAAITIAVVASLETLLNVEAVDKLDPHKRLSPPNRELVAQGVGNISCGFLGGLPITSVIVRSSVGINAGGLTRMTCFIHGMLLLVITLAVPQLLNQIPLACLAAILLVTGLKLASPELMKQMWREGYKQFLPFIITIVAIVLTDLLVGIVIGLMVSAVFILQANLKYPLRQNTEVHASGELTRIELAQHVTFLNRAALREALHALPEGGSVVIDATGSQYIEADIIDLLEEFEREFAPAHGLTVSRIGFRDRYKLDDRIAFEEVLTKELQASTSPQSILQRLKDGNQRYVQGQLSIRDHLRQIGKTAQGQYPLVVVLSCMDSRVHADMIFDMGLGDMFTVRMAGNIATREALGSMEYGCAVVGAKVILVLGHTRCGAVSAGVDLVVNEGVLDPQCNNLSTITDPIAAAVNLEKDEEPEGTLIDRVTRRNVYSSMETVQSNSLKLAELIDTGQVLLVGGIYDVDSGQVEFFDRSGAQQEDEPEPAAD